MSTDSTPGEDPVADDAAPETPEAAAPQPAAETEPAAEPVASEPEVAEPEVPETQVPSSDLPELNIGSGAVESALPADYVPVVRGKVDRFGVAMGTGRRKTSVARVRIKEGTGNITVNGRSLDNYFSVERDRQFVLAPLKLLGKESSLDVTVRVGGGGTTGQTGAIVLGIGRALQGLHPESHHELSAAGFLTRDSRMVERKKYGYRKARRSFQFSKR